MRARSPALRVSSTPIIGPALLALLLCEADEREFHALAWILHLTWRPMQLMALYEFAAHTHCSFPYRLDGVAVRGWIAAGGALQGHPLVNAAVTCGLSRCPARGRAISAGRRLGSRSCCLQSAALLVFGGRSALITAMLVSVAIYFIFAGFSVLARRNAVSLLGASVAFAALGARARRSSPSCFIPAISTRYFNASSTTAAAPMRASSCSNCCDISR